MTSQRCSCVWGIPAMVKHTSLQRRCRRNELYVNKLKMARGCAHCDFVPVSGAWCRLLDLHHKAPQADGKKVMLSDLVWSGAGLERIGQEIAKGIFLCKHCHSIEHGGGKHLDKETERWAADQLAD